MVAVPVFVGRIPSACIELLKKLEGTNTPAIAVVVYGNREYEDALLELSDLLTEKSFIVVGAAAFVAQHSIFPKVAKGRPDANDTKQIQDFALKCLEKLNGELTPVTVKGNKPYRTISALPIRPTGNSACTSCQSCVKICPTDAIDAANPKKADKRRCISCTACIHVCSVGARAFRGLMYKIAGFIFSKKCSARKEPDIFI
jgi:ferredoxin